MAQKITITCLPGASIKPGDILPNVLKDTDIPVRVPSIRHGSTWVWDYSDVEEATWNQWVLIVARRLNALTLAGTIRNANWT